MKEFARAILSDREDELTCADCKARLPELIEAELMGTDLGEDLDEVQWHLALCPHCAQEYRELQALAVLAYDEDLLEPSRRARFDFSFLEPLSDVPERVGIGQALEQVPETIIRVIQAVLLPPQPALALRGRIQRREYEAEDARIGLEIHPAKTGYKRKRIVGRMTWRGQPATGAAVRLYTEDEEVSVQHTSSTGHFRFDGLAEGVYGLRIQWREAEIRVEELVVQ